MKLKSEFSLSDNRAGELARLVNRYKKLDNIRELTQQEKDLFAKDSLGVSMKEVEKAFRNKAEGRDKAYNDMLDQAAATNQTTPEMIGKFFDTYVNQ